jgi:hypothetical protein
MNTALLEAIELALSQKQRYAQEAADGFKRNNRMDDYLGMATVAAAYGEASRIVRLEFEKHEREAAV